jgi:hypothetical protein
MLVAYSGARLRAGRDVAEPKESDDDEVVKVNSSPPDDGYDGPTRIGEDAYARLARGMLHSPEPPPSAGPPRSFSSRHPGAPPSTPRPSQPKPPAASPSNHIPNIGETDPSDARTMVLAPPPPAPSPSAAPPTSIRPPDKFPFAPPPPPAEPPPRAIRADIVVAVGAFFVVVVAALIYLYFRELMRH